MTVSARRQPASDNDPDFRRLVRGAFLSAISILISMAALLITGKLFTNALDQEQVGIFALLLVCSDFIIYAAGLGFAASMPKLIAAAGQEDRKKIIASALAGQLMLLCAVSAAVLLLQAGITHPERISTHRGWLAVHGGLHLLPLLFVTGCLRDLILAMLAGLNRYGWRAGGITLASLTQVAAVWVFIWQGGGGLTALVIALAASYALALALLWIGLGSAAVPRFSQRHYREAVLFSAPLYLNQVMNFFHQRFDTVLVSLLAGVGYGAVYEMLKRIPLIVNRTLNALLVPYLPHISRLIAREDRTQAAKVLNEAAALSAFIGYGAALFFTALQTTLIPFLFNKEYLTGSTTLFLLLLAASLALQSGVMAQMLIALGRNLSVPIVNMSTMALCLFLDLLLIPRWGLAGAAGAAAFSSGGSYALMVFWARYNGIRISLRSCALPLLLLSISALSLYYEMQNALFRLLPPVLFTVLCLMTGVTSPGRLHAITKALLPGSFSASD